MFKIFGALRAQSPILWHCVQSAPKNCNFSYFCPPPIRNMDRRPCMGCHQQSCFSMAWDTVKSVAGDSKQFVRFVRLLKKIHVMIRNTCNDKRVWIMIMRLSESSAKFKASSFRFVDNRLNPTHVTIINSYVSEMEWLFFVQWESQ